MFRWPRLGGMPGMPTSWKVRPPNGPVFPGSLKILTPNKLQGDMLRPKSFTSRPIALTFKHMVLITQ
jgi:hypothetical protein